MTESPPTAGHPEISDNQIHRAHSRCCPLARSLLSGRKNATPLPEVHTPPDSVIAKRADPVSELSLSTAVLSDPPRQCLLKCGNYTETRLRVACLPSIFIVFIVSSSIPLGGVSQLRNTREYTTDENGRDTENSTLRGDARRARYVDIFLIVR